MPVDPTLLQNTWNTQAWWSAVATKFKTHIDRWRAIAAVAGLLGALLETLAASLGVYGAQTVAARTVIALLGAAVLAVVPVAIGRTSKEQVRDWIRARSASEGLKEEIWRFLAGGRPYGAEGDAETLIDRRAAIIDRVTHLANKAGHVSPQTQARPTQPLSGDEYSAQRVTQQIENYYAKNSARNSQRAEFWRTCVLVLGLLAAIAGAVSGGTAGGVKFDLPEWFSGIGPWVAVVTTASAAVTAQLAAGRYDELAVSYAATANRLVRLRDLFQNDPHKGEQARLEQFVEDVESAISSENEGWRSVLAEGDR